MTYRPTATRWPVITVVATAILVTVSGLDNGFAYDDVALLVEDDRLHAWATLPARLGDRWWPTGLFRPISLAALGLQWLAADGAAWLFRVFSTLVYALVSGTLFYLALLGGAGRWGAVLAGMLFAIHPVHVEVTANVVGQAELLSALFGLGAVAGYLRSREGGSIPGPMQGIGLGLLVLFAANAKESGYVIIGLLLAAELILVTDPRDAAARWLALRPLALLLTAVTLASLLVRFKVLGALGGETPHPSLVGLSVVERAVAMMAIVPEWTRLLLWPARLQAEYGPPGLVPLTTIGASHLVGLAVMAATMAGIWVTRHRAPLVAFGLTWTVVALLPVANLLAPTGLLLAERTLFLPSAGVALVLAGLLAWISSREGRWPVTHPVLVVVVVGLIVLGGIRSAKRQPVWRDTLTLLSQTVEDAPASYRARAMFGRELARAGRTSEAVAQYREAIALWAREPLPFEELGQLLRVGGDCAGAIPILQGGVLADSTSDVARSRLVECLIAERQWDAAEWEISRGLAQGVEAYHGAARRVAEGRRSDETP